MSDVMYCTRNKEHPGPFVAYTKRKLPDGTYKRYFMCRPCNAERHRKWYQAGNSKKQQAYNRNFLAKRGPKPRLQHHAKAAAESLKRILEKYGDG